MRLCSKLILAALSATMLLGIGVSSATARSFEIGSWERGFRIVWTALEFSNNVGLETVRCPVTLEGTFHRSTYAKVSGTLIGYVTRAIIRGERTSCTGGTARIFGESLPWHLQYSSFAGTLPDIESVTLVMLGAHFGAEPAGSGLTCNGRTEAGHPGVIQIRSPGVVGRLRFIRSAVPSGRIPLEGSGLCAFATGELRSINPEPVTVLGETAFLGLMLI
jgi:hypothetical protein